MKRSNSIAFILVAGTSISVGSSVCAQGILCENLGSVKISTNNINSQDIILDNATITVAAASTTSYGAGTSTEFGPHCYPRHAFLFINVEDSDAVDLLQESTSTLARVRHPDVMLQDRTIGRGRIEGTAGTVASLLSNSTRTTNKFYAETCSQYYCSQPTAQDEASALNIANAVPILGLSYGITATNTSLPSSLTVDALHNYDMKVFIDGVLTLDISKRRATYYRLQVSSSIETQSIYGLYGFDDANNKTKMGIFQNTGFTDTSFFDMFGGESEFVGQVMSSVEVDLANTDTVDISITQIDVMGDSPDTNQDGFVESIDRAQAQSAVTNVGIAGDEWYLPQIDFDLDGDNDSADLWAYKELLFDTEPVCLYRADANNNGVVESTDFNAWIALFNNNSPFADANNDGMISATDYNAWTNQYNACTQ